MFSAERSWLRAFQEGGIILDTVASNVLSPFHTQTLTEVLAAQAMRPSCKAGAIVRSAPESARAHSILLSVAVVRGGLVFSCQQTGPALALIDPLRQGLRATGLLNDLVTLTAIRLSSLSAGPDAMRIGVVFTGTDAVRILAKSVGRDKPQNRVTKSTGVCCLPPAGVGHRREADENPASGWCGAMQQAMRGMMPILSVMKVGRDRPQLCARELTEKLTTVVST